jgi:hypothetical protein
MGERGGSPPAPGFGVVPLFVEHCEAVVIEIDVKLRWLGEQARRGLSFLSDALPGRHVALEVAFEPSVVGSLWLLPVAAAVQRIAIETERQRSTLRQTRRTVPITFSIMLVQASEAQRAPALGSWPFRTRQRLLLSLAPC